MILPPRSYVPHHTTCGSCARAAQFILRSSLRSYAARTVGSSTFPVRVRAPATLVPLYLLYTRRSLVPAVLYFHAYTTRPLRPACVYHTHWPSATVVTHTTTHLYTHTHTHTTRSHTFAFIVVVAFILVLYLCPLRSSFALFIYCYLLLRWLVPLYILLWLAFAHVCILRSGSCLAFLLPFALPCRALRAVPLYALPCAFLCGVAICLCLAAHARCFVPLRLRYTRARVPFTFGSVLCVVLPFTFALLLHTFAFCPFALAFIFALAAFLLFGSLPFIYLYVGLFGFGLLLRTPYVLLHLHLYFALRFVVAVVRLGLLCAYALCNVRCLWFHCCGMRLDVCAYISVFTLAFVRNTTALPRAATRCPTGVRCVVYTPLVYCLRTQPFAMRFFFVAFHGCYRLYIHRACWLYAPHCYAYACRTRPSRCLRCRVTYVVLLPVGLRARTHALPRGVLHTPPPV